MDTQNSNNNKSDKRIEQVFKTIADAFDFARKHKNKEPKVRSTFDTDIYTVSYLKSFNSED